MNCNILANFISAIFIICDLKQPNEQISKQLDMHKGIININFSKGIKGLHN